MDWIDRVWLGAAWLIAGIAGVVALWGVVGDWVHGKRGLRRGEGRRRCGRCGYDMRGVNGTTCPECGRVSTEKQLARSRVRWRRVAAAVVLLVPAWVLWGMPAVRVRGWIAMAPSAVLAGMVPIEDDDLSRPYRWSGSAACDELLERGMGPVSWWIIERRCIARQRRMHPDWTVEVFDDVEPGWTPPPPLPEDSLPMAQIHEQLRVPAYVANIVTLIDPDEWSSNGGDGGAALTLDDRAIIACPPERMVRVRALLNAVRNGAANHLKTVNDECVVIDLKFLGPGIGSGRSSREFGRDAKNVLTETVDRAGWADNGGERSVAFVAGDVLIVRGPARVRERIVELARAIEAANAGRSTRLALFAGGPEDEEPVALGVWPVREVIVAWGGLRSRAEWDRWVAVDPENRDPELLRKRNPGRSVQYRDYDGRQLTAYDAFREARLRVIAPQREEEGELGFGLLGEVLIAYSTRHEDLDKVDAAVREGLSGPKAGESSVPKLD